MDIKSRGLKNRTPLSNAVKTELHQMLTQLSDETKINKSKLLDEALYDLMIKYKKIEG